ncbi:hypothetical protein HNV12_07785 [Methanococcoides sp. SA1]|nr:hypothetical protein [Methanococcoides sp. SA1]
MQIERFAKHLYFTLQSQNKVRCKWKSALKITEEKLKRDGLNPELCEKILKDLINLGILKKEGNYVKYGFHQSFQEFYAALKLKELFEKGIDISPAFSHPKWENAVIFTSEMIENSDTFIEAILEKNELELASKCSKNIDEKLKNNFCSLLYEKRNSKYSLERIIAVEALGRLNDINHLTGFIKDEDPRVREVVAKTLGEINSDEAIRELCILIKDEYEQVMEAALFSLAEIGSRKSIRTLFNALKLEDDDVTETAIDVLSTLRYKIDLDLIIEGLTDANENVKISSMFLIEDICFSPKNECEKLVDPLIKALEDTSYDVRVSATRALSCIVNPKAVEAINNLLISGSNEIRESIVDAISEFEFWKLINIDAAVEAFVEILKTETDCEIRANAINIIGSINSDKVTKTLLEVLRNDCTSAKKNALDCLPFELNENLEVIIDLLKEEDDELKIKAIRWLGKVKSKAATEPLKNLLENKCPEIRENTILALGEVDPEYIFEEDINKLNDDDSAIKIAIVKVTGKFDSEKAANQLVKSLKDNDDIVRLYARQYLLKMTCDELEEILIKSLPDKNVHLKCTAADILGEKKSNKAVKPLIHLLEDKDNSVKIAAAKALGLIQSEEAVNHLIELLCDANLDLKKASITALGKIKSESAIEPLIEMLTDSSPFVVRSAISALGYIKSEKACDALLTLFFEKDSMSKSEIVWSLGNLEFTDAVKPIIIALEKDNSICFDSYHVLRKLCTIEHKNVLESFLKSDNPFVADICFELLHEITKNEMMEKTVFQNVQ